MLHGLHGDLPKAHAFSWLYGRKLGTTHATRTFGGMSNFQIFFYHRSFWDILGLSAAACVRFSDVWKKLKKICRLALKYFCIVLVIIAIATVLSSTICTVTTYHGVISPFHIIDGRTSCYQWTQIISFFSCSFAERTHGKYLNIVL